MLFLRPLVPGLFVLLSATPGAPALAQLAPAGFSGAINSPTADVLGPGLVSGAWSNSNPEKPRGAPAVGSFGSLNLGFGVLPGLELVGRLAYEGDLQCSLYSAVSAPCGGMRDLSASAKYQLPVRLGYDTRLAIGAVDVGGAATNFRSYYGVATTTLGALDLSLGYARGNHPNSSLSGVFGSTQAFLTDHWRALAEYDSHELRAGLRYARPLTGQLDLELGASRSLTNRTGQQAWQAGIGLSYSLGKQALSEGTRRAAPAPATAAPLSTPATLPTQATTPAPTPAPTASPALAPTLPDPSPTSEQRAQQLAGRLQGAGFASVWIGFDDAKGWVVQAEPVAWRKSRLDALGVALALWHKQAQLDERLHLVLSYLQDPVLSVRTTAPCLTSFTEGGWWCDGQAALKLSAGTPLQAPALGWSVAPETGWAALRPQIELSPLLRQRVGTEVALYDASLGMALGWELPLGRGLQWQGELTLPLASSSNFADGAVFASDRIRPRLESSTLSRQMALAPGLWAQASLGYVMHNDYGGQLDLAWLSPQGSLRLGALGGYYQGPDASGQRTDTLRHPLGLAAARWSVIDGRWFLEAQAGQFYNQDRGLRLASQHWYGDNRLTLHYRNTQTNAAGETKRLQFAGFQISMPIGPRQSGQLGPASVRGADQWAYGLESKVGGSDNAITTGTGLLPELRHGLVSDTLDKDRAGLADVLANIYRVRAMLREIAERR